jgi:soluble lytic murein transglycosylase-like protein
MKSYFAAAALLALTLAGCAPTASPEASVVTPEKVARSAAPSSKDSINSLVAYYAKAHDVPESLVHMAIKRESGYNPALKHGPFWGLMQIRYDTAKRMGYSGPPSGLLDPDVNLAHAVPYLANAYRVADGDERRAIKLYASGYYYEAKRRGLLKDLRTANSASERMAFAAESEASPPSLPSPGENDRAEQGEHGPGADRERRDLDALERARPRALDPDVIGAAEH